MTKTRIRYKKHNEAMVSTTFFPTLKGNAYVYLFVNEKRYELVEVESGKALDNGSAKDMISLKKSAKDCLVKNGVVFTKEEREHLDKLKDGLKAQGIENL